VIVNLFPAYGRTYSDSAQAQQAWQTGQAFNVYRGGPASISDAARLEQMGLYRARLWSGGANPRPLATIALHVSNA
jgi:hypothetical protein